MDSTLLTAVIGGGVLTVLSWGDGRYRLGRLEQKVDDLKLSGSDRVHERLAAVETKLGLRP